MPVPQAAESRYYVLPMTTTARQSGGATVLDIEGKLKMGEPVDQFRTQWMQAIQNGTKILIINLGNVPMIDSSGVGSLMRCYSAVRAAGGRVKLVAANDVVRYTLGVTHLEKLFDFYTDEAAALASVQTAKAP
jgi:anti-anti-sigma factor